MKTEPIPALEAPLSALTAQLSGLYEWQGGFAFNREELRLDVDGKYPQFTASGAIHGVALTRANWIANVNATPNPNIFAGPIWYKNGPPSMLLWNFVTIEVTTGGGVPVSAKVTLTSPATPPSERVFTFRSPFFHPVEFEFDSSGTTAVTSIDAHAHPNRPATLPAGPITLPSVYTDAGFDVRLRPSGLVPAALAGPGGRWSDLEMHDAMQAFWSRFANAPQWSMWVFFASLHETGTSLGGVMFDDIGPNHRQGTAIFNDAFISIAPAGDPAPAAWVRRMRFWTAAHEMGHAFNLAHSWQKSLGARWIPGLVNEPEARSFMNYPFRVSGGQSAFFANFGFRFSPQELLFMRHAPEEFVQMGNADWFDNHAFEEARISPEPKFTLELRSTQNENGGLEFMEPGVIELKLTNVSGEPQVVAEEVLKSPDHMTVIIKKRGKAARQFLPYSERCYQRKNMALEAGGSVVDSLFLSAGKNGWDLAEPGYYLIQVALHLTGEDIVSEPLTLRIAPPKSYDQEYVSQDYFSDDVGRVLTFDGTRYLTAANNTLQEVAAKLSGSLAAVHARVALASPMSRDCKVLDVGKANDTHLESVQDSGGSVKLVKANLGEAAKLAGVLDGSQRVIQTLCPTDYGYYTSMFKECLAESGGAAGGGEKPKAASNKRKGGKAMAAAAGR